MKYSFKCPAPCNYEVKVDAKNDDEAVERIIKAGEVHRKQAHPNMPPMTDEQLKTMVRSGMKKG
jgi:predicted small metal-binding protein